MNTPKQNIPYMGATAAVKCKRLWTLPPASQRLQLQHEDTTSVRGVNPPQQQAVKQQDKTTHTLILVVCIFLTSCLFKGKRRVCGRHPAGADNSADGGTLPIGRGGFEELHGHGGACHASGDCGAH